MESLMQKDDLTLSNRLRFQEKMNSFKMW